MKATLSSLLLLQALALSSASGVTTNLIEADTIYKFKNRAYDDYLGIKSPSGSEIGALITEDTNTPDRFRIVDCPASDFYQIQVNPCEVGASPLCLEAVNTQGQGTNGDIVVRPCKNCDDDDQQWSFQRYEYNSNYVRIKSAVAGGPFYMEAQKPTAMSPTPFVELNRFIKNCAKQAWKPIETTCPVVPNPPTCSPACRADQDCVPGTPPTCEDRICTGDGTCGNPGQGNEFVCVKDDPPFGVCRIQCDSTEEDTCPTGTSCLAATGQDYCEPDL